MFEFLLCGIICIYMGNIIFKPISEFIGNYAHYNIIEMYNIY